MEAPRSATPDLKVFISQVCTDKTAISPPAAHLQCGTLDSLSRCRNGQLEVKVKFQGLLSSHPMLDVECETVKQARCAPRACQSSAPHCLRSTNMSSARALSMQCAAQGTSCSVL